MVMIKCNLQQANVLDHDGYDSSNDHQYSLGPCSPLYVRIFIVLHVIACVCVRVSSFLRKGGGAEGGWVGRGGGR